MIVKNIFKAVMAAGMLASAFGLAIPPSTERTISSRNEGGNLVFCHFMVSSHITGSTYQSPRKLTQTADGHRRNPHVVQRV